MSTPKNDTTHFPVIQEMLKESGLENVVENIIWVQMSKEEAAVALVEMDMMIRAALSNNLNLRKRSKIGANYYQSAVGNRVHIMASAQAKSDLGITERRMSQLFAHKDKVFSSQKYE
ncbi:hypothetical protein [Paenibacillus sp. FSL P4-0288]|uniref:hypothetical protein n=1 Tax=Paenibacillus sp. FSL P4-0288 TaxID=2921633 RepID=UPI0030F62F36